MAIEFLRSFLRRHLAGKPVVASPNVCCHSLRLTSALDRQLSYFKSLLDWKQVANCSASCLMVWNVTDTLPAEHFFRLLDFGVLENQDKEECERFCMNQVNSYWACASLLFFYCLYYRFAKKHKIYILNQKIKKMRKGSPRKLIRLVYGTTF